MLIQYNRYSFGMEQVPVKLCYFRVLHNGLTVVAIVARLVVVFESWKLIGIKKWLISPVKPLGISEGEYVLWVKTSLLQLYCRNKTKKICILCHRWWHEESEMWRMLTARENNDVRVKESPRYSNKMTSGNREREPSTDIQLNKNVDDLENTVTLWWWRNFA